jgi:DNA-binding IclR family transcriptional regulator
VSRVQSIERAFAVLGALTDGPIGVTEVAERVELPKSTAARMLQSLAREGAVEQVPGETRYRLGPRIERLAAGLGATRTVAEVARPHLAELALSVGEAAGLAVPEEHEVHYVDQVDTPNPVGIRDWTGSRVPLHAVSSGLVFLAHRPSAAVERYLSGPLLALTPRTTTDPDVLR